MNQEIKISIKPTLRKTLLGMSLLWCAFGSPLIASNIGLKVNLPKDWRTNEAPTDKQLILSSEMEHIIDAETTYRSNITAQRIDSEIKISDSQSSIENLVKKYSKLQKKNPFVTNYKLGSQEFIELEHLKDAIIYYSYYSLSEIPLMQVNLIIPANKHHYFVSYTDLVQNIEGDSSQYYNDVIWPELYAMTVNDPQIQARPQWQYLAFAAMGLFFIIAVLRIQKTAQLRGMSEDLLTSEIDLMSEDSIQDTKEELSALISNPQQQPHPQQVQQDNFEDDDFFDEDQKTPLAS